MFEGGNYRKICIFQQVDMIFSHGCSVFSLHNHFRKHSQVFTFYAAAAVWFKFHRLFFFCVVRASESLASTSVLRAVVLSCVGFCCLEC